MKKLLLVALAFMLCTKAVSAQDYNWGIGLRGGLIASGLDVKVNFDPTNSLEMLLSVNQGISLYGLYERNVPIISRGFNLYYGAGAHMGTWEWGADEFTFGVDGIVGLEYTLREAPFCFSIDYKPCLNLTGDTGFKMADFALTVRYTF